MKRIIEKWNDQRLQVEQWWTRQPLRIQRIYILLFFGCYVVLTAIVVLYSWGDLYPKERFKIERSGSPILFRKADSVLKARWDSLQKGREVITK